MDCVFFGSENNDYEVMLEIKYSCDNSTVVSEEATFYSKLMLYKGSSYYGFEILFDFAVYLKKTTEYRIEASGPNSWFGNGGLCVVQISGVTFTTEPIIQMVSFLNFCFQCNFLCGRFINESCRKEKKILKLLLSEAEKST